MESDYSNKKLQKASFRNMDLSNTNFAGSDLRGADFTGANLTNADLSGSRTGITPVNVAFLFIFTLLVSLLSGYVAMLAGTTMQQMVASTDEDVRTAGYVAIGVAILFILLSYWRGVGNAVKDLIMPVVVLAVAVGTAAYISGMGTGMGMLYLVLSCVLLVFMFVIGTVARASAGSLSNIIFIVVAVSGASFGKTLGGGLGTVVMALACAVISKRALSGAHGFGALRKLSHAITRRFGTSFRRAKLTDANFQKARLHNADFTDADMSLANWHHVKKINCVFK